MIEIISNLMGTHKLYDKHLLDIIEVFALPGTNIMRPFCKAMFENNFTLAKKIYYNSDIKVGDLIDRGIQHTDQTDYDNKISNPSIIQYHQCSKLACTVYSGNLDLVKWIFDIGINSKNIHLEGMIGYSMLNVACFHGYTEIVKLLRDKDCLRIANTSYDNSFIYALSNGHIDIVKILFCIHEKHLTSLFKKRKCVDLIEDSVIMEWIINTGLIYGNS